jgi:phosphopantothenoylcysteine synthetase/decarboxylase
VDRIRTDWRFGGVLVKFKLEVGVTEDELKQIAETSRQQSQADWIVANTLDGASDWALLGNGLEYERVTRDALASTLLDALEKAVRHG